MPFNLEDYEPVEKRLSEFWARHLAGRVITELLSTEAERMAGRFIVKASVYRGDELGDRPPAATGLAMEIEGEGRVNQTSALENCETSAIGRALANFNYAAKGKRPSREEMAKTVAPPAAVRATGSRMGTTPTPQEVGPVAPPSSGETASEPPEESLAGTGKPVGKGKPVPVGDHAHVWADSPTLSKFEICAVPGCLETRRKKVAS